MIPQQIDVNNAKNRLQEMLQDQGSYVYYVVYDQPSIIIGNRGGVNEKKAQELGLDIINIYHEGSAIVSNIGDVDIAIVSSFEQAKAIQDRFIELLQQYLTDNGYENKMWGNDLLVNDKKCFSYGSRIYQNVLYVTMHVSIKNSSNIISQVCLKPCIKQPGGLSFTGLDSDKVIDMLSRAIKDCEEAENA